MIGYKTSLKKIQENLNHISTFSGHKGLKLETNLKKKKTLRRREDGGNIGGSRIHFPATPGKYLADLRSRANSQQYSSIYEDQRPKIEDIERSDGKKSAQGQ